MNPFNNPSDLLKSSETFKIVDSSSEDDIQEEEIIDNSSPECPGKKSLITPHKIGCTSKRKSSIKRNILNHKPMLDIFIKSSKSNKESESVRIEDLTSKFSEIKKSGSKLFCSPIIKTLNESPSSEIVSQGKGRSPYGIKRKLPLTFEINSNGHGSYDDIENKIKSFCSSGSAISLQKEFVRVKDEIDKLCKSKKSSSKLFSSLETKALNEFPSPEIVSRKGNCQYGTKRKLPFTNEFNIQGSHDNIENKLRSVCTMESAISLQEEFVRVKDEIDKICKGKKSSSKLFSSSETKALNESPNPEIVSRKDHKDLDDEIIFSPDSSLNLSDEEIICSPDATLNLSSEGPKDQFCLHDLEEEIIFSPDVSLNLCSEENNISDRGKKTNVLDLHGNKIEDGSVLSKHDMDVSLKTSSSSLNMGGSEKQHKEEGPTFLKTNEAQVYTPQNKWNNQSPVITTSMGLQKKKMQKAPKKGTLLERAFRIMSNLRKEANLFSHEIKVGLRTSKGLFASEPLSVKNILYSERYYIVTCIPQDVSGMKSQLTVEQKQERIHLILLKIAPDINLNSILVIHFPFVALVGLPSMTVILFAGNRIQTISVNKFTEQACSIDKNISNCMIGPNDQKVMRVIKNKNSRDAIDVVVNQSLGNDCLLELRLLHLFIKRTYNSTNIELLAIDSEKQFYLIKDSKYISLKDIHVEVNNSYMFLGFRIKKCCKVKDDVRSAAEYYSTLKFESDFIYILEPYIDSWEIKFNRKIALNLLECTPLSLSIPRFTQLVKEYKVSGNKILIRGESLSEMRELQFDDLCNEQKIKFITLSAPFILKGIYFIKGCLFYDKYSQIKLI